MAREVKAFKGRAVELAVLSGPPVGEDVPGCRHQLDHSAAKQ